MGYLEEAVDGFWNGQQTPEYVEDSAMDTEQDLFDELVEITPESEPVERPRRSRRFGYFALAAATHEFSLYAMTGGFLSPGRRIEAVSRAYEILAERQLGRAALSASRAAANVAEMVGGLLP